MNDDEGAYWAQMQDEAAAAEAEYAMQAEAEYNSEMERLMNNRTADIINLAGFLYDTYCFAVGGVAYDGKMLPTWDEFRFDPSKEKQVAGWYAVAEASIDKKFQMEPHEARE
jgi:hypothetical protein